jgi:hypothetical protein
MQQPRQMYQDGSIMPRLNQLGSGVSSAEQMLQGINQRLDSAESTLGEGGAMQQPALQQPIGQPTQTTPFNGRTVGLMQLPLGGMLGPTIPTANNVSQGRESFFGQPLFDTDGFRLGDQRYGTGLVGGPSMALPGSGLTNQTPFQSPIVGAMRGMAADGGMMGRQNYGLGSLVKSIGKGIKKFVKSDLGKAALLGVTAFGLPGGALGMKGFLPQAFKTGAKQFLFGGGTKFLPGPAVKGAAVSKPGIFGALKNFVGSNIGTIASTVIPSVLAAAGAKEEDMPELQQDSGKLAMLLEKGYRNLNPGVSDEEVAEFVRTNVAEGGRIGYAMGSPEDNAIQAAGIEGLRLNKNPAGVTELDLRETGGFIPPVGVKEKADDIPAMLSNNEFVMTADAVREFGDGDVDKGAERMYAMMKTLENGGRV